MIQDQQVEHFLTGKVIRFEDKMAIVKVEDGLEIPWPIKELPSNVDKGSEVRLDLSDSNKSNVNKEEIAKTILNEILKK